MNIIKDYIGEVIKFIKNEQSMDTLDYIFYVVILLLVTLYIKSTRAQICILNFNLQIALQLLKIALLLLVYSTLLFNLYKVLRNRLIKQV